MRPLKLTVSGFGPYAKEQVFDLEKLGNYGIYLITGDTGAGKTTIFDAINFALFGEASGKDRDGKMLRSKYAGLSTETFVELEFLYRDEKYVIRRNPEYERLAKRGKNLTTKQAANATLILPDGKIIDKSEKNVNKKVEEILGITQKQFKQICMIAQGDFMKILLADTKERSQTFRKIFNTEKYESFEKKLDELNDKYKNQYNSLTDKLSNSKENISFDENEEFLEKFPDYENRIKISFQEFLEEVIDFQKKKNDIYSRENDEIQAKKEKNLLALNEAQEVENKKLQLEQKNSEFEIVNKDVKIYKDLILLHPELQKSVKVVYVDKLQTKNDGVTLQAGAIEAGHYVISFELKHQQSITLPVKLGTKYRVYEKKDQGYREPRYERKIVSKNTIVRKDVYDSSSVWYPCTTYNVIEESEIITWYNPRITSVPTGLVRDFTPYLFGIFGFVAMAGAYLTINKKRREA